MIRLGIIGGAGYTAGELLRILINHPEAEIVFIHSRSNAGNPLYAVHRDLAGDTCLRFTDQVNPDIDLLFLCAGHGQSIPSIDMAQLKPKTKIIDLSNDFRLHENNSYNDRHFVYGLPEFQRNKIKTAENIANPGCFATGILLALLPLAKNQLLTNNLHVHAITGSTGAGQSLRPTSHFSYRQNNLSVYKAFTHQHLGEICQTLTDMFPIFGVDVNMIPLRGDFTRGIFTSIYMRNHMELEALKGLYCSYYKEHPFTHVSETEIDLKQVVNTNKCLLHLQKYEDKLLITSSIDNLLKGASGQAVQNMNLMFGLNESTGLRLKAPAF